MKTMRYRLLLPVLGALLALPVVITGCSDDEGTTNPPAEFTATDADFASYASWTRVAGPIIGPDPSGLEGNAHLGNDSTKKREVFVNNASATRGSNNQWPNGTIFAKRISDTSGTPLFTIAMAKRGGSFNAKHKGWEWFLINPTTGAIQQRGDSLVGGCNGCHEFATNDYVFSK